MDEKEIKSALDSFEDDDFLSAKEKLKAQILKAKNDFLKNKLGLKNDIYEPVKKQEPVLEPEPEPKKRLLKPKK